MYKYSVVFIAYIVYPAIIIKIVWGCFYIYDSAFLFRMALDFGKDSGTSIDIPFHFTKVINFFLKQTENCDINEKIKILKSSL